MQNRVLRVLLLVSIMVCFAAGYHWFTRPDGSPPTPPDLTGEPDKEPGPSNLISTIARMREQLRNVPGRTGILAETRQYSLFDEELIIRDFFQDREGGFFVDVGCAWPIKASNTYYLEKHLGWKGIAIDALREYASDWERERPATKFLSYLVTDHSGTEDTFFKSQSLGLSSAERRRADGRHFGDTLEVEEILVPSTTLDDLLAREGVTKIDLLAMDIEGHELKALRGLDIDRFRPELVVAEGKRLGVTAYLDEHGYEVIERYQPFDFVNAYYQRRAGAHGSQ
ncbi:MAG: FkbM family methyltransferase [Myxococcota bacterium]